MARHPFDALSFLFGLVFAAAGLLLVAGDPARGTIALDWAGPVVAIGLGIVVLAAALRHPGPDADADAASNPAEIES